MRRLIALAGAVLASVPMLIIAVPGGVTPGGDSAEASPVGASGVPRGQWLASGVVRSETRGDYPLGTVLVRAWIFRRACDASGACHTVFVRQIASGPDQQATLVPQRVTTTETTYSATFPPLSGVSCQSPAQTQVQSIRYILDWRRQSRTLTASDTIVGSGCPEGVSYSLDRWSAVPVAPAPVPPFEPDHQQAASTAAFLATASTACGAANSELIPVASKIANDVSTLRTSASTAADAAADNDIAAKLVLVMPVWFSGYTQIPQPPGALASAWSRDLNDIRRALAPAAAMLQATERGARLAGEFTLTNNPVDAQTANAELAFANADTTRLNRALAASASVEQTLGLTQACRLPDAVASILTLLS